MTCSFNFQYILISAHLYYYSIFYLTITLSENSPYIPSDNIALNCGSSSSITPQYDGRNWTGDIGSKFISSNNPAATTNSTASKASFMNPSVPEIPYLSARIFHTEFTYNFNVTPGSKFVRLHFYPSSYTGLEDTSKSFVTVTACSGRCHTLLRNFSASLSADYFEVPFLMKEFIVYVNGRVLDIKFVPSSSNASVEAYAFVNGIEVVSLPLNLYLPERDAPRLHFVGQNALFYVDYNYSMETCYRLNVGGNEIPPKQDTGMLRSWTRDDSYIFGAAFGDLPFNFNDTVRYPPNVPPYTAPEMVYQTARSMGPYSDINLLYNLSWFFPIDSGFSYLVRLHFCEVDPAITKTNQRVFDIFINNDTAEFEADVIAWSNGYDVPVYRDYVVLVPKINNGEKQDLWLELHPNTKTKSEYYDVILNGAEIFKLSNYDGNLAGPNPPKKIVASLPPKKLNPKSSKKITVIMVGCFLGGLLVFFVFSFVLYMIIRKRMFSCFWSQLDHSKSGLNITIHVSPLCHRFSIKEIKAATSNFDEALVVGTGGFGNVYKGCINGGAKMVAVKRGNRMEERNIHEFQTEITMVSQLRHHNLVSLIGYCLEEDEMILVYEYMENGTLYDHLHGPKSPLTWEQRLKICIGAARGLHYIHSGSKHKIIHRDIKPTNILLDENWDAKVSDFGISKLGHMASSCSHVTTEVKGTLGYLDPEYYRCYKLSEKSDVYSFGVVLLEVLSAKSVMNPVAEEEDVNLVEWVSSHLHNGIVDHIVDTSMKGTISRESFVKFLEIAMNCLAKHSLERPTMGEVLWDLELSLKLQTGVATGKVEVLNNMDFHIATMSTGNNSDATPGIEFSEIVMPLGR
ncbi:receptor-like protein kinase FERONIA [Camellia sinensis]|uniref:Protein kinase domain-containing protein n=1 Tax=Camellia sinensis var. sinensis TaxID=542762 RepID=A0A4S4E1D5_CAMSN|nr:receptor-like protein kinase FERONIA [Camellia sinensis]THG09622.1 hypothetical protein TEA_019550 [Camellia sinensis var. sinensis]